MRHLPRAALLAFLLSPLLPQHALAQATAVAPKYYDASGDFSTSLNPAGAWSYGYRASAGAPFTPYASNGNIFGAGADTWSRDGGSCPFVAYNNTGAAYTYPNAPSAVHPAGLLNLHPGPAGEWSVVRWVARAAGTYSIEGRFQGMDTGYTTSDVSVAHNSQVLFSGNVNGYGAQAPFSLAVEAAAGDVVEFSVGWGGNGNYYNDSTGLAAAVSLKQSANPPAEAPAETVVINFDDLPARTTVTTQYPIAVFSAGLNRVASVWDYVTEGGRATNVHSGRNSLSRRDSFWGTWDHFAPLTVEFTKPVRGLKFFVAGIDNTGTIAQLDVFQNNAFAFTMSIPGFGWGYNTWINLGPTTTYPNGVNNVTKIVVRDITDAYGVSFDDFGFTPEEALTVNITNQNVSGSLNGTTRNAMPYADVRLQANASPAGGAYAWTFTGPVAVTGGASNSPSVTIKTTNVGTVTARVTYTLNGASASGGVTVNSVLPTVLNFSQSQGADWIKQAFTSSPCENSLTPALYALGCNSTPSTPLEQQPMRLSATVVAPGNLISEPSQSGAKVVQAVSGFRKVRRRGNTLCKTARVSREDNFDSGWQLDFSDPLPEAPGEKTFGSFPANGQLNFYFEDSPSTALANFVDDPNHTLDVDAASVHDYYEDYIYYYALDPRNPPFQRELTFSGPAPPVARVAWRWGGQVVYDYIPSLAAPYTKQFTIEPAGVHHAQAVGAVRPYREGGLVQNNQPTTACPGSADPGFTSNNIDWPRYFVNQHYKDFLLRAADQDGSNFWTANITRCGFDLTCIDSKRVDVSRAFFYSGEFIARHPELAGQRGTHEYNAAFVYWCYRTYLQREPNAPPDNNWEGYNFWVGVLDRTNPDTSDYKYNEIIRAFLLCPEYRARRFDL